MRFSYLLIPVLLVGLALGADNGKARSPPMGWRSWNCYHGNVNQQKMESIMDQMAAKNRSVAGKKMSLVDLGYNNCGLDDNWQQCKKGYLNSFHDKDGNPLVRSDTFPSMKAMTDHGHKQNIFVGWYMNNCICSEHMFKTPTDIQNHMVNSVKAIVDLGFDGIKLDGCGQFRNLTWWYALLNATGREVLIENCHWGGTVPGQTTGDGPCSGTTPIGNCPYNFYRTSGDIGNNWGSMTRNLHTTTKFQGEPPLSRPGQWAYPDMMEVGRMANVAEDRSHFGAWAITSSPLILGYDLNDQSLTDKVWDIISNQEAIAVNQQWEGHPGRLVKEWNPSNSSTESFVVGTGCGHINQTKWSYDAANKLVKGPGGGCLDAADKSQLQLKTCDAKQKTQQFTYGDDHTLKNSNGQCVDVFNNAGPVVQLYGCNKGGNQNFDFNSDGTLTDNDKPKHCLTVTSTNPHGGSGFMLWAKKQPNGAQAVLVINGVTDAHTAVVKFSEIGISSNSATVRDIWNHKDLGAHTGSFTTASIGSHDSVFLLVTPK